MLEGETALAPTLAEAPSPGFAVLSPDVPRGADDLGRDAQAGFFAELLAHKRADTPFTLGVFGPAGSGKSFFVESMLAAVERLSAGAERLGAASAFVPSVLTVRVDAGRAAADPAGALASAVLDALASAYPKLAADARHAGGDPVEAAREINETLNEARRRLDAERQTLDGLRGREARLSDQVLFEAAGSRVDAYARSNRSRVERALRSFGFLSADPVATYKDLVREAAEMGGSAMARMGLGARSLWAYQGQTRLIIYAVLFALVAWGASLLRADQQVWLDAIRSLGDKAAPVADWAQAHVPWLGPIGSIATLLVALALLANIARAVRFLQPILRGVTLLGFDIAERRRDLNGFLAHQTRRVDALTAEVEGAAAHAVDAERRAGAQVAAGLAPPPAGPAATPPFGRTERDAAGMFFATLARSVGGPDAPGRIVVALDGLDAVGPAAAADLLRTARRLLGPGLALVLAADRAHLATGFGETDPALAAAEIVRGVQLAYDLAGAGAPGTARSDFARRLIAGVPASAVSGEGVADLATSALDDVWRPGEADTVAALAPFAGEGPRATKSFVNAYRVARADPALRGAEPPVFTALALALAVAAHGTPDAWSALEEASEGQAVPHDAGLLRDAVAAARAASGVPVELGQARRALDVARRYMPRA